MSSHELPSGSGYLENLKLRIIGHYLLNRIPDGDAMREAIESLVDIIQVNSVLAARRQHLEWQEASLHESSPMRARLGEQFVRPAFPITDE